MKTRLRADLRNAMKGGRTIEKGLLRALVAAIDNAEAPPPGAASAGAIGHAFGSGSAEVDRLLLSSADVRGILLTEIDERERAATKLEQLEKTDLATALREEIVLTQRYLE